MDIVVYALLKKQIGESESGLSHRIDELAEKEELDLAAANGRIAVVESRIGAVLSDLAAGYDESLHYNAGDLITYEDSLWICDSLSPTTGEFDESSWISVTVSDLLKVKADLVGGKIPESQLPSYVDDVIEGYLYNGEFYEDESHTSPLEPMRGKIYVSLDTGFTYRWSGSMYVQVGGIDINTLFRPTGIYITED